ncbi:hypothetical protein [Chishuiella changwenlii]|uniref:hypothetical protein n=1 Tax=Chishuiella changwenlii TaxID=1434701 RepID=UPI002FD8CEA1
MFTLRGVSNCGKSSKVKDIADWIINTYPQHININNSINLNKGDIKGILQINNLKIGFNSSGDDISCVLNNDDLLNNYPDIDILINSSRTKGATRNHLEKNYNYSTGWLVKYIYVQKFNPSNLNQEQTRDNLILDELKSWLIGLEK